MIKAIINKLGQEKFGIVFLTIYCLVLSLQGFDLCDEGLVLSTSQQIFHAPESVEFFFLWYLTGLIGGIWEFFFGWGGYLSFRLLNLIFVLSTYHLLYQIFKGYTNARILILLGYFMLLSIDPYFIVFHYNRLTSFLGVAMCAALLRAYKENDAMSTKWLYWASFIYGLLIFARLTNVCFGGVVGAAILFHVFKERSIQNLFKYVVCGFSGLISAVILLAGFMWIAGHLDVFISCMKYNLFSAVDSSSSSHNLGYLLHVYTIQYKGLLIIATKIVIPTLVSTLIVRKVPKLVIPAAFLMSFSVFWMLIRVDTTYIIYVISFLISILSIYKFHSDYRRTYLLTISFFLAVLFPIGSDNGLTIGHHLLTCLLILSLINYSQFVKGFTPAVESLYKYAGILSIIIFLGFTLSKVPFSCYFDEGSRLEKRYQITQSDLANTFTSQEKAQAIDTLLIHLKPYIHEGDYTLFFKNLPMLHYMTRTKPYLHCPWVFCYAADYLRMQFERSEREIPVMPVLVREKGCLPGSDWTIVSDKWDRTDFEDDYLNKSESIAVIQDFIKRHNYHIVWENNLFAIYLPGEK